MANLNRLISVESDAVGVESWTMETLQERYLYQPLSRETVSCAMSDRELLFDLMESRRCKDENILQMCDYLMDIRHQFVKLILDEADRHDNSAETLRQQVRNI